MFHTYENILICPTITHIDLSLQRTRCLAVPQFAFLFLQLHAQSLELATKASHQNHHRQRPSRTLQQEHGSFVAFT